MHDDQSSFPNETRVAEQSLLVHYRESAGNVWGDTPPPGAAKEAKHPGSGPCPGKRYHSLLHVLESRFRSHVERHAGIAWEDVLRRLESRLDKLRVLQEMERSGGEPDVIGYDEKQDAYLFVDCSAQSPQGRRSLCFDVEALRSRKHNPPRGSACGEAGRMGVELLDEAQYRLLQRSGSYDTTTSSWIRTPDSIRRLGGALFCDRRYDTVFVYHNGADSYYAARGFRVILYV